MRILVYLLFFLSGATGLLYEVVWIRLASTVLGNTTYAVGTVVGVFMGGMALGAWRGGKAADRRSGARLLRLYAFLELGVAASALAVPWLLRASDPLFRALWPFADSLGPLYGAIRIAVMSLVLAVPTTLMGATLPVLARFLTVSVDGAAGVAGRAYAVNTLGGVLGTLAAGFVFMPALGVALTTWLAVAANAFIGGAALLLARGRAGELLAAPAPGAKPAAAALAVAALSGCAALAYQTAWTRALVLAMGCTVYSFTIILAVFILGLAAGGAAGGRLASRVRDPRPWLGGTQAAIAVVSVTLLPYLLDLPLTFAPLVDLYRRNYGQLLGAQSLLIFCFLFPPTLIMGAVFPLACRAAAAVGAGGEGRTVAAVYSANTLGSILGTALATFLVVPRWGLTAAIQMAAALNVAGAGLYFWGLGGRGKAALGLLSLAYVCSLWMPLWNPAVMASGAYMYGTRSLRTSANLKTDLKTYLENQPEIIDQQWDAYGLVTVHRRGASTMMRINGKIDASTNPADMRTQTYVAHLPLLHHPDPRRVLVVGLGAGFTLGVAARYPQAQELHCVEISPAVVRAASHFSVENGDCLRDPRVRLVVGDGRQAVRYGREPWDVIICEPSNLWLSGMANLFTRDFFREVRSALRDDGVFCQWIHSYRLGDEDFVTILRTFFDVFEGGSCWELVPGGDYVLIGSRKAGKTDFAALAARVEAMLPSSPELRDPLQPPMLSLLGQLVGDGDAVRRHAGKGPLLTDDLCTVEYTAPRMLYQDRRAHTLAWLDAVRAEPVETRLYGGLQGAAVDEIAARRNSRRAMARAMARYTQPPPPNRGPSTYDPRSPESMGAMHEAMRLYGVDFQSMSLIEERARELVDEGRESLEAGNPDLALRYFECVPVGLGATAMAKLFLGRLLLEHRRDLPAAKAAYDAAAEADPQSFGAVLGQAWVAGLQERTEDFVAHWRRAAELRPRAIAPWMGQAHGLRKLNRLDEARAAIAKALEIDPANAEALALRKELGSR